MHVSDSFNEHGTIFTSNNDDENARIVFDLGLFEGSFSMTHFALEKILITTNIATRKSLPVKYFPNPVNSFLQIENISKYIYYEIFNTHGIRMDYGSIFNSSKAIDMSNYSPGTYIVRLTGKDNIGSFIVIKE